jgi:prophage regulatory protein
MATSIRLQQNSNTNTSTNPRIIRWPKVHDKVDLCRSHVHKLVSQGLFPSPIKLTPNGRASGWVESEVNEWLEQRIADSRCNNAAPAYGDSL